MSILKRLDYLGNAIFTLSMVALLFGLVEGGTVHPWSLWRIILPLVLGIMAWISITFNNTSQLGPVFQLASFQTVPLPRATFWRSYRPSLSKPWLISYLSSSKPSRGPQSMRRESSFCLWP